MFGISTMIPPLVAWNAPAMAEFLWTPIWTWPVTVAVVLEVAFVVINCGLLWILARPRPMRVRPQPHKRRGRAAQHTGPLREVRSRRRAA